jgi:uncharacterized protein (DUF1919 family)
MMKYIVKSKVHGAVDILYVTMQAAQQAQDVKNVLLFNDIYYSNIVPFENTPAKQAAKKKALLKRFNKEQYFLEVVVD